MARAAHAVYWFCRYTDDIVDECPDPAQARRDLDDWSRALDRALTASDASHPVLRVFLDAAIRHQIPHEYPRELIAGMRMDLELSRYENFEDLKLFCYRVASVVGLMMCHVIGLRPQDRDEVLARAADLGIAMQLTNILRDIGEDRKRGRLYLPQQELDRFSVSEQALFSRPQGKEFDALMRFQIERARRFYASSAPGIPLLNPEGRFAVAIASDTYRAILSEIEAARFDVFSQRAYVRPIKKYGITARHLARRAVAFL